MLKHDSSLLPRHLAGIAFAVVLTATGMFAVSSSLAQGPSTATTANALESADPKFVIDAEDMDTRKILAMIAEKGERNILVSDQVSGKITVHLKDVTWREALDVVAKSQGLAIRQSGNLTLVDVAR